MSGHLGYKKTYYCVCTQYYSKDIGQDVKTFAQSCLPCQLRKLPPPRHSGQLQLSSASQPFQVVEIDIFRLLPSTTHGNRYVVVILDRFSRETKLAAGPNITATIVADVLVDKVVFCPGCPSHLLSDRGTQFVSRLF